MHCEPHIPRGAAAFPARCAKQIRHQRSGFWPALASSPPSSQKHKPELSAVVASRQIERQSYGFRKGLVLAKLCFDKPARFVGRKKNLRGIVHTKWREISKPV